MPRIAAANCRPPMTERGRLLVLAAALLVTACGQGSSQPGAATAAPNAAMPARVTSGDLEVLASVVPAASLGDAIARRYRVEPARNRALVLVSLRRGPDSPPARVTGEARDLRGVRQVLEFEAIDVEGVTEHVATARVEGPDTLRFDLQVATDAGERASLRFSRDIPR